MSQVYDLFRYWEKNPPVDRLFAAFVGFEPRAATQKKPTSEQDISLLIAMSGGIQTKSKDKEIHG